ncbi:MAG TPA: hypothetical protein VFE32_12995 [Puia sp.]|jgi:hypothetical protein|nr:hypothetical protein [Puia sp.]
MKRFLYSFIFLLLAAATGCSLLVNPLPKIWFYTYGTGTPNGKDSLLSPASFLELRPDGSYTRDFGAFESGTWLKKDHQLILTSHDHQKTSYALTLPSAGEMQLTLTGGYVANFESRAIPSLKDKQDPFSVFNNRWRIHATHKESDAEIRQRLFNHCQFWEAYFRWALDKSLTSVDVRSTPTPIKIYGNGFTLKPTEDLPAEWVSCFYDADDCRKASDMIKDIFEHKTIAWAQTDNKFKMFLSAFQQIQGFLR